MFSRFRKKKSAPPTANEGNHFPQAALLNEEIEKLREEIQSRETSISFLESQCQNLNDEIVRLQTQLKDKHIENQSRETFISFLENQNRNLNDELAQLQTQFEEAKQEYSKNSRSVNLLASEYDRMISEIEKEYAERETKLSEMFKTRLRIAEDGLNEKADKMANKKLHQYIDAVSKRDYFKDTPAFSGIRRNSPLENSRLITARKEMPPIGRVNVKAEITGHGGNIYETTLYRCSCPDFQIHNAPCKHMYRLAFDMGVFLSLPGTFVADDLDRLHAERDALHRQSVDFSRRERAITNKEQALSNRESAIAKREAAQKKGFKRILNDTSQQYPWLAKQIADFDHLQDMKIAEYLRTKPHPAKGPSDKIANEIAKEKKKLQLQCKLYEYQLNYYESVFPWLEEFKKLDPKEGAEYVAKVDSDYDNVRNWISPNVYFSNPSVKRNQIAFDHWKVHKRSDWEAGIDYERYVGYTYEQEGYRVDYHGATRGLEDMGRDLIAENSDSILVIQCKRWASEKVIHEKHIFQIYGSAVLLSLHSEKRITPLFITTTALSDTARECAAFLNVEIRENFSLQEYPMIKCNISKNGEKIYHLPFDQQYDRVVIEPEKGEFYAWTVQEAEDAGFRRAYKWHGND